MKTISKKEDDFCDIACELAKQSDMKKSKHGAVLVHGKDIIGKGYNKYCKNKECYTIHAEVDAILDAMNTYGKKFLPKCKLYVIRISNIDKKLSRPTFKFSKPCEACSNFICKNKIEVVYYSID